MRRRTLLVPALTVAVAATLTACGDEKAPRTAAPSSTPTTTSAPVPSTSQTGAPAPETTTAKPAATTFGPQGYGAIKLGMSAAQARATGLVKVQAGQPCSTFSFRKGDADSIGGYIEGNGKGVVSISAPAAARTPAGIGVGSSYKTVKQAYPGLKEYPNWFGVAVPGNPSAQYSFLIPMKGTVKEMTLTVPDQSCHN